MASNTAFTLSASDLSGSPDDVITAVELLQAHGFVVTREPICQLAAVHTINSAEVEYGDAESIRRSVRRALQSEMGTRILTVAGGSKSEDGGNVSFSATVNVIRPTRGINSIAELLR